VETNHEVSAPPKEDDEVNQRHVRRSQPTREAALKDACSQLLEGHAFNRIVGPNETITAERVKDWCAKHRSSPKT
jgi:hypothetical protein